MTSHTERGNSGHSHMAVAGVHLISKHVCFQLTAHSQHAEYTVSECVNKMNSKSTSTPSLCTHNSQLVKYSLSPCFSFNFCDLENIENTRGKLLKTGNQKANFDKDYNKAHTYKKKKKKMKGLALEKTVVIQLLKSRNTLVITPFKTCHDHCIMYMTWSMWLAVTKQENKRII